MNELVSIIIPTYKRSNRIERALKSAAEQTYKKIEIIVVDDNANFPEERRKTVDIVKRFKGVILVQNKKNLGGALSRNEGIKKATGDYVTFLDDDDEYCPEKVEKQLAFMVKNKLDASFSNELVFDESGKFQYKESHKKFNKKEPLKYHLTEKIIGPQTFMYRKEVLDEIGGFDNVPAGQEYVLMYKTIMGGYKIDYFDADLVNIYIYDGERISTSDKKIIGERMLYDIKKKHFDILNFRERQRARFEWFIVCYRFYRRKKSLVQFKYLATLFVRFPVQMGKTTVRKFKKKYDSLKYQKSQ